MDINDVVVKWLKNKKNYVFFESNQKESFLLRYKRIFSVLAASRVCEKDLASSKLYFILKKNNQLEYKLYKPQRKQNFQAFNKKAYEYLLGLSVIFDIKNYSFDKGKGENNLFIYESIRAYNREFSNGITKFQKDFIFNKLFESDNVDPKENIVAIEKLIYENDFDYIDIKLMFEKNLHQFDNLTEAGVFFPVKNVVNIFDTNNYAFEINKYKFKRRNVNYEKQITEYYSNLKEIYIKFGESMKNVNNQDLMKSYLECHATNFDKDIAYYNPFCLCEFIQKNQEEYEDLCQTLKYTNKDIYKTLETLLEYLNYLRFVYVTEQQENLFNTIYTHKSYNKKMSIQDIVELKYKQLHSAVLERLSENGKIEDIKINQNLFKNIDSQIYIEEYLLACNAILNALGKSKGYANSLDVSDIVIPKDTKYMEKLIPHILDEAKSLLNKDYPLKERYEDYCRSIIKSMNAILKLNSKNKEFIYKIIQETILSVPNELLKKQNSLNREFQDFFDESFNVKGSKHDGVKKIREEFDLKQEEKLLGKIYSSAELFLW